MFRLMRESKIIPEDTTTGAFHLDQVFLGKMNAELAPLEQAARVKYHDFAAELDGRYLRERKRQDQIGINLS